jgi:formate dehydrogenase major subunit
VSAADADRSGLRDGDPVRVVSRYGSVVLRAQRSPAVGAGQLFATFHTPAIRLNAVTGPLADPISGTPEYKITAVRIEPAVDGSNR